jgi:hypothetical protein
MALRASRKQNKTQLTSKFLQLGEPTHSDWDCHHHSSVLRVLHCIVLYCRPWPTCCARAHTHTRAYCVPLSLAIKSREGRNQCLEGNKALDAGCGFFIPIFLLSPLRLTFMVHQSTLDVTKSIEKTAVYQRGEITVLILFCGTALCSLSLSLVTCLPACQISSVLNRGDCHNIIIDNLLLPLLSSSVALVLVFGKSRISIINCISPCFCFFWLPLTGGIPSVQLALRLLGPHTRVYAGLLGRLRIVQSAAIHSGTLLCHY